MNLTFSSCQISLSQLQQSKNLKGYIIFFLLFFTHLQSQDSIYYHSDFESNDGGLTATGSWEWGLPFSGPDTAHSGFMLWGTNLNGNYPDLANDYLELPTLDLSTASSARLTFWHWYEFEEDAGSFFDGGNLKISTNGEPFEILTPFRGYDGLIDKHDNVLDGEPTFSGFDNQFWHKEVVNLHGFVGNEINLRFHMGCDSYVGYAGWYIDDVSVAKNLEKDVAIWSVDFPAGTVDFNNAPFFPVVSVYNAGAYSQSFNVEAKILLNGVVDYLNSKNISDLDPDETRQIDFHQWVPSDTGHYTINAQTYLASDQDTSNDSFYQSGQIIDFLFTDVTEESGLELLSGFPRANSVAFGDYNNDGFYDIYAGQPALLKNSGNGSFYEDISLPFSIRIGIWGDYDNDGNMDLFLQQAERTQPPQPVYPGHLFRNEGTHFTDVTDQAGFIMVSQQYQDIKNSEWLDYDNDGLLDLYISMPEIPNHLYHNEGNGTFIERAGAAGVDEYSGEMFNEFDYDDDGYIDLLIRSLSSGVTKLMHNEGNGTFKDLTATSGLIADGANSAASIGDFNNDGLMDIYMIRSGSRSDGFHFNLGNGKFSSLERCPEIQDISLWWISNIDYNNDGFLDLLVPVRSYPSFLGLTLYCNENASETFTEKSLWSVRKPIEEVWQLFCIDYDNDGDQDIYSGGRSIDHEMYPFLLRNNEDQNNWIEIKLKGIQSNQAGFGSRVRIMSNGNLQVRQILCGASLFSHNTPLAHFGLGEAKIVDTLEVKWPSGLIDNITNIPANQIITIEEGNGIITTAGCEESMNLLPNAYCLYQNFPNPFNPTTVIRYELPKTERLKISIYNPLGQRIRTLINAWKNAGKYEIDWDGSNDKGEPVQSGIYFYRLEVGPFSKTRKMILIR
jgi:hypothetical protein